MSNKYQTFSNEQEELLNGKLNHRLISNRKGGSNSTLKYIEGHDAIDQANRIFGYGNWSYSPVSCEQCVLTDPSTGEAIGISYKAKVELIVRGCVGSITEVGSQPVSVWNVQDTVLGRRKQENRAKPIEDWERANAMRTIVDAHEMAEKGAVTDALKRALRTFGEQFGNGLYGDGRVDFTENSPNKEVDPCVARLSEIGKRAKEKGLIKQDAKLSEVLKYCGDVLRGQYYRIGTYDRCAVR